MGRLVQGQRKCKGPGTGRSLVYLKHRVAGEQNKGALALGLEVGREQLISLQRAEAFIPVQ